MAQKKSTPKKKTKLMAHARRKKSFRILTILTIVVVAAFLVFTNILRDNNKEGKQQIVQNYSAFKFTKHGELTFTSSESEFKAKIDIEIAEDDEARGQGMMYRNKLEESQGMFFIFDREQPQSFWMRNTPLSLDMLFVNKNNEIVKIHKDTTPFSESSYASLRPAIYVVEVIAGYTDAYDIKDGDKIVWRRL
jgi:uncharacterized membrane protein (UPF0127 family)